MSDIQSAELAGTVAPSREDAGFILPVFRTPYSNDDLIQVMGPNGQIEGFRSIRATMAAELDISQIRTVQVGDEGLWAFRDHDGTVEIAPRSTLVSHLAGREDLRDPPFLELQVAEFCGGKQSLPAKMRNAYEHFQRSGVRSATAWRDVVVVPAAMRRALRETAAERGLDFAADLLNRKAAVAIEGNRICLYLDNELYEPLMQSEGVLQSLSQKAGFLSAAFDLATDINIFPSANVRDDTNSPGLLNSDTVLIGIGQSARSILQHLYPLRESDRSGLKVRDHSRPPSDVIVIENGEVLYFGFIANLESLDELLSPRLRARTIFTLFGARPNHDYAWQEACRLASRVKDRDQTLVAVVANLPDVFGAADAQEADDMFRAITVHFDQVCFLSDRSPYLRNTSPFGPASSYPAVATRLASFLSEVARDDTPIVLRGGAGERSLSSPILIIGSAADSNGSPSHLVEHAMRRLSTPALVDWEMGPIHIDLQGFSQTADALRIQEMMREPNLENRQVSLHAVPRFLRGPKLATVFAFARDWQLPNERDFEAFCRRELETAGWLVSPETSKPLDVVAKRKRTTVNVECRTFRSPLTARAVLTARRIKRDFNGRHIIICNASIRRSVFAKLVLHGLMPLHFSRIADLERIFERRYLWALRSLEGDPRAAKTMAGPALRFLLHELASGQEPDGVDDTIREVLASPHVIKQAYPAHVVATGKEAFIAMPILIKQERQGTGTRFVEAMAHLQLDREGWLFFRLERKQDPLPAD